jgi:hypothetical protein
MIEEFLEKQQVRLKNRLMGCHNQPLFPSIPTVCPLPISRQSSKKTVKKLSQGAVAI